MRAGKFILFTALVSGIYFAGRYAASLSRTAASSANRLREMPGKLKKVTADMNSQAAAAYPESDEQAGARSEERQIAKEVNKTMSLEVKSPVMDRFKDLFRVKKNDEPGKTAVSPGGSFFKMFLKVVNIHIKASVFYYAASAFILGFTFLYAGKATYYVAVKFFMGSGWAFSRLILFLLSSGLIISRFAVGSGIMRETLGSAGVTADCVFLTPIVLLASSAAARHIYDYNFPVLRSVAVSLILPAAAFFIM